MPKVTRSTGSFPDAGTTDPSHLSFEFFLRARDLAAGDGDFFLGVRDLFCGDPDLSPGAS